jgi:hypothetical protein
MGSSRWLPQPRRRGLPSPPQPAVASVVQNAAAVHVPAQHAVTAHAVVRAHYGFSLTIVQTGADVNLLHIDIDSLFYLLKRMAEDPDDRLYYGVAVAPHTYAGGGTLRYTLL